MNNNEKNMYHAKKAVHSTFVGPIIIALLLIFKTAEINTALTQLFAVIAVAAVSIYGMYHLFLSAKYLYLSNKEDKKMIAEWSRSVGLL